MGRVPHSTELIDVSNQGGAISTDAGAWCRLT